MSLYQAEKSILQRRRPEWDIDQVQIQRFYPDSQVDPAPFVVNNFFRGFGHKFLHTEHTIRALLGEAGFHEIVACSPGSSSDIQLCGLEAHDKLIGKNMNLYESMVFEACK